VAMCRCGLCRDAYYCCRRREWDLKSLLHLPLPSSPHLASHLISPYL
jgi:hypothetical protein